MNNEKNKTEKSNGNEDSPQEASSPVDAENESRNDESLPGGYENNETNHWVKEIPDDSEISEEGIVENLDDLSVNKGDLPDWINELSPTEQENFDVEGDDQENKKNQEAIQMDRREQEEEFSSIEPKNLDEGFVEISEYGLEEVAEQKEESQIPQDPEDEQEDLPDWLEEMITEDQQPAVEDEEPSFDKSIFTSDEPTKPVLISEEPLPEEYQEEIIDDVLSVEDRILDEIDLEETESQIEENIHLIEFDTDTEIESEELDEDFSIQVDQQITEITDEEPTQVIDEFEDYEKIQEHDDDWEIYDQQPLEIPKTLRFAKYLLDQGKIDQADQIFQTYIKKAEHLEEIKGWITDAFSDENISQSKLWEILGDIAINQSEHNEALTAYTRSISILLKNQ